MIVDPVQGEVGARVRDLLVPDGRHVLCGHAGGLIAHDPHFYVRNHTLVGATLGGYPRDEMRRIHDETQRAIEALDRRRSVPAAGEPRASTSPTCPPRSPTSPNAAPGVAWSCASDGHLRSRAAAVTGHGSPRAAPQTSVAQRRQSAGPGVGPRTRPTRSLSSNRASCARSAGVSVASVSVRTAARSSVTVRARRRPSGVERDDRHAAVVGRARVTSPSAFQRVDEAHHPRRRQAEYPPQRVDAWRIHEEPFDHRHCGRRRRRARAVSGDRVLYPVGDPQRERPEPVRRGVEGVGHRRS